MMVSGRAFQRVIRIMKQWWLLKPYSIDVCIYKYTDQASDLCSMFGGNDDVSFFQCQISHNAKRSITFGMYDSFNDFLKIAARENAAVPPSLQHLYAEAGWKLVVSDRADPESVGFQPWRVAFYCTDVRNFLLLLDGWFQYKAKEAAREQLFQVVLHPHFGIDLTGLREELLYVQPLVITLCLFTRPVLHSV